MLSSVFNFVLRGAQALFGIVVMALSISLIRNHHWGETPASLIFGAIIGGLSLLAAFIGFAGIWIAVLGGMVSVTIDGIIALANIIGGIVYAVKLKGVKCEIDRRNLDYENFHKLTDNEWFNGGCRRSTKNTWYCWVGSLLSTRDAEDYVVRRCKESQADTVFMFLTAIVVIVCALLVWLRMRKGY